jgi:hypothetical protein
VRQAAQRARQQAEQQAQQQQSIEPWRNPLLENTQPRFAPVPPDTTGLELEIARLREAVENASLTPEERAAKAEVLRKMHAQREIAEMEEQSKRDEAVCHEEIQLRKWNHQTEAGKTFMIGVFKERHLGDRKADVEIAAKQIGARFYRLWEHHKWGNLEEVKVLFYK